MKKTANAKEEEYEGMNKWAEREKYEEKEEL